jgi:transposase InsO family protein
VVSNVTEEGGLLLVHRNARLAPAGRLILVQRVLAGRPVAHVAKELGVSRQCAHRWVSRFRQQGPAGLLDRSSRPRSTPSSTSPAVRARLLELRRRERLGRDELARRCGVSPSTASRIIARAGLPRLHELDPVTGIRIRAARRTQLRYEHPAAGDLIHIDVKKLGRIPDGGGWRINGPDTIKHPHDKNAKLGYDYVHVAVDDHSRLAFAQVLPDEKGPTCAAFLLTAAEFFAGHGITISRVMTDNALNYRRSNDFRAALTMLDAKHILIRPHSPWQNGKAERFNRTLQDHWAYRRPFTSNHDRLQALQPWLDHYNYDRAHTACNGQPPISRVSPTS